MRICSVTDLLEEADYVLQRLWRRALAAGFLLFASRILPHANARSGIYEFYDAVVTAPDALGFVEVNPRTVTAYNAPR